MHNMKSYTEVKTQEDMEKLLSSIACFHDSMTKEIHIVNRGWVNRDHSMAMSHSFDLQLLIQSQWEPYAIELVFCNVIELHLSDACEYWDATGSLTCTQSHVEKTEIRLNFDSSLIIKASQLYYKNRSDWLGKKSFLKHEEVPSNNAIPAKALEHNWRQCQECFDAWEENIENVFSYCSGCGQLTELI